MDARTARNWERAYYRDRKTGVEATEPTPADEAEPQRWAERSLPSGRELQVYLALVGAELDLAANAKSDPTIEQFLAVCLAVGYVLQFPTLSGLTMATLAKAVGMAAPTFAERVARVSERWGIAVPNGKSIQHREHLREARRRRRRQRKDAA